MATFVLIHGAWHGAWCWERLTPLLAAMGHRVIAPDLPGMGADATPLADVSLEQWGRHVAAIAADAGEPVILVGHSRGGLVISQAAEYAPEHIRTLVYLNAMIVPSATTMQQMVEQHGNAGAATLDVSMTEDRLGSILSPASAIEALYNRTDPDVAARAAQRLCIEPIACWFGAPLLSEDRFGRVPRAYIEGTEDRIVTLGLQRHMQASFPCDPVITLPSDHSPFYSAPEALAEGLHIMATTDRRAAA